MKRILTGIKPTGTPHLGNYIGAIKPAIELQASNDTENFYFIADLHALNQTKDKLALRNSVYEIAATWLALGLDPEKSIFYKQSDVPEISELFVILSSLCPKGLMNRAHAYKAAVDKNNETGEETDSGINMGLYNYPILMASDILLYNSDIIPVGKDQLQHVEIARDLAGMFNHHYKEIFTIPEALVDEKSAVALGLDGRKMSKSYNNVIPIFAEENILKKKIKQIVTDSSKPEEKKNYDESTIGSLYNNFATKAEVVDFRMRFEKGISWNDAKEELFRVANRELSEARKRYNELINNRKYLDEVFSLGAEKARYHARKTLSKVKKAVGLIK